MAVHQWNFMKFTFLLVICQTKTHEIINNTEVVDMTKLLFNDSDREVIDDFEINNNIEIIGMEEIISSDEISSADMVDTFDAIATTETITANAKDVNMTYEGFFKNSIKLMNGYDDKLIDYITYLFCYDGSYRFIHIYVERSLSTTMADKLIIRLNQCMNAGILTSRYNFNGTDDFSIPFPISSSKIIISIQVFVLNIVRNLNALNLSAVQDNIPRKPRIRHFILCEEQLNEPADDELLQVFSEFWKNNVLNALVIYRNRTEISAVSFTPFPRLELLFIEPKDLRNKSKLYADKTRNLYGHALKATIFFDSSRARFNESDLTITSALDGVDGLLARLIVEQMNATLIMTVPADNQEIGEILNNGTVTGCLGAIMSGEVDFGINMRFYRLNQFEGRVEATFSNGRDDICFLVPKRGSAIDMTSIFRPFQYHTWIAVGLLIPSYVLIFYLIVLRDKDKHSFIRYFMIFYAFSLQQSSPFSPTIFRQRFLFLLWLFIAFLLSSLFQGKMSGSLIMPKDRPDYNTIDALAKSNLKIMSLERYNRQMAEFLRDKRYNGVYEPLIKRFINSTLDEFNNKIVEFDAEYGFANKDHINAYLRSVYKRNAQVFFHQVKQCAIPFLGVYGVRYGTPYKGRINYIIRQAQETGLIEKWERSNKVIENIVQSGDANAAFSVKNLQTAFLVYGLGCLTCFTVFILELSTKRFFRQNK